MSFLREDVTVELSCAVSENQSKKRVHLVEEKSTLSASFHVIFSRTFRYANRKSCSIF